MDINEYRVRKLVGRTVNVTRVDSKGLTSKYQTEASPHILNDVEHAHDTSDAVLSYIARADGLYMLLYRLGTWSTLVDSPLERKD